MIELPEALTIARQLNATIRGKVVESGDQGNSPHRFAFYTGSADEYAATMRGRTVGEASASGSLILVRLVPDHVLVLGDGGERILYHAGAATLPKKRQLTVQFADGSFLTVGVQGWGVLRLLRESEIEERAFAGHRGDNRVSPLDAEFTLDYFQGLFAELRADDRRPVKQFVVSEPGVWGVGNGCLQDVLLRAGLHQRRRAASLSDDERRALYTALRRTVEAMAEAGGRDSELDVFGRPGGYRRLLSSEMVGQPCPVCGAAIEKAQFLGGSVYTCPTCQRLGE